MAPNDVGLARVWTAETDQNVLDVTFVQGEGFDVVVGCEAGIAILAGGGPYTIGIVVRDLSDNTIIIDNQNVSDTLSGAWSDAYHQHKFTIPGAATTGKAGHCCEVLAYLSVGAAAVDASFARSPMFLITS